MTREVGEKKFTQHQIDTIVAYAVAKERLAQVLSQGRSAPGSQRWLEECIEDLVAAGVSPEEADVYFASRRWFREAGLLIDLDEPGAPSEAQLRAYRALSIASQRIGEHNYRTGVYKPGKVKPGSPLTYRITDEHRLVVDAMSKVLDGSMSPEEAMALLHEYEVMKQRVD